ncbi:MAG: DUF4837 family protein, partial [Fidelibacterota bacterium]
GSWGRIRLGATAVAVATVTFSCAPFKKEATGPQNRIVVVVSPEDIPLVKGPLDSLFSRVLYTPEPEPYFDLVYKDPFSFRDYDKSYNLTLISLFTPGDTTGDRLVRDLLPSNQIQMAQEGENRVFSSRDLFAREQVVLILAARDAGEFREAIQRRGEWIFTLFDEAFLKRQEAFVFKTLEQKDLSRRFQQDYGWHMRIQHDYVILAEQPARNFVKLGRSFPYRWISVHWTDHPPVKGLDILTVTDEVEEFPTLYLKDMSFPDHYRHVERTVLNGREAFRVEGLWERTDEPKGGPFVSYLFYDPATDRRFHINLLIHYPGGDKGVLLRQMEVMARTFSVEPR